MICSDQTNPLRGPEDKFTGARNTLLSANSSLHTCRDPNYPPHVRKVSKTSTKNSLNLCSLRSRGHTEEPADIEEVANARTLKVDPNYLEVR